jgi:hypothetical protein
MRIFYISLNKYYTSSDMNDLDTISNTYIVNLLCQIKLSKTFKGDINKV